METFSFSTLLAVSAEESGALSGLPVKPVWMCYLAGNGPRLWRGAPPGRIRGGVLSASDARLTQIGDPGLFCQQAVRECRARGAFGFWANWSREPTESMETFTAALDAALSEQKLALFVPEPYGGCCPSAHVLISSALCGGTLKQRLTDAVERFGRRRVVLAVERMREDFSLPAPEGRGSRLSPGALERLMQRLHPKVHYAPEFCASYFTYEQDEQTHFVLFDTAEDVKKKLRLAEQLELEYVLMAWQENRELFVRPPS